MCLTLSVCDMFAASNAADELRDVVDNHCQIERYKATPFNKREEAFPEGEPKRIELSEKTLQNLHKLMLKLSYESKSTLFDAEDQDENASNKTLIKDDPYAYPTNHAYDVMLINTGPSKLMTIKTIKSNTLLSLKQAKDLVDEAEVRQHKLSTPVIIATYPTEADARKLVNALKEVEVSAEISSRLI